VELLRLSDVSVGVAGAALLANVSLAVAAGDRVGLVGANGSGKSSLLRVMAGKAAPLDGRVLRPPGVSTRLLSQAVAAVPGDTVKGALLAATLRARELESRLREWEARASGLGAAPAGGVDAARAAQEAAAYAALTSEFERAGGYGAEAGAREVAAALGFRGAALGREVRTLSAGESRRLQLAVILVAAPDVLLLDEPTNHLDMGAREWLAWRLRTYPGGVVVVSHDRALLDAATTRTLFLADGRAWPQPGAYSLARRRRDADVGAGRKRARELEAEAARLERMAAELAAFGHKAAARRRRATREGGALRARLGKAGTTPAREVTPRLAGGGPARSRPRQAARAETLVTARHLDAPGLMADVSLEIGRGERIALVGPNGSGKSTLLHAVAGAVADLGRRAEVAYLPGVRLRLVGQLDRGLEPGVPLVTQVAAAVGDGAARRLLADAGVAARAWDLPPEAASGGERTRAGLALAFAHHADLWLLDEPTNDLDLEAVEALEEQLTAELAASGAALLLVTHDRRLAERLAREVWSLVDGRLERYGSVDAYLRGEALASASEEGDAGQVEADGAGEPGSAPVRTGEAETERPASGPDWSDPEIAALEEDRSAVLALLADPREQTERDRERLRRRLAELEEALMQRYAAQLAPPAPRYSVTERGVTVTGDLAGLRPDGTVPASGAVLTLAFPAPTACGDGARGPAAHEPSISAALTEGVAHLRLREPSGACLLPWARSALVDAATRLAFTVLGASAVQLQTTDPVEARWLREAGDGWRVAELTDFLRAEGWTRGRPRRGRRRRPER